MNPQEIGLIDSRNESLWNDLNAINSIVVKTSTDTHYSCYSENQSSTIFVPVKNVNINSFTHELLHILIREKEIFFGSSFRLLIESNPVLSNLISDELLEHFGNCMDHIKMLPIYLELGFDEKEFIEDYNVNKFTKSEVNQLKDNFKLGNVHSKNATDFFIGKYISVKADANKNIDYSEVLNELENLDSELFQLLELCFGRWKKMPLESKSLLDDDYRTISLEFYQGLSDWAENKIFI
ncbi:MAG: hypothetical protein AAF611_18700 [Bacteroidota bacterium]